MEINIFNNASEAAKALAKLVHNRLEKNPKQNLGVATGRTMDAVYLHLLNMIKEDRPVLDQTHFFALDEYIGLAKNDPHSYSYYLNLHLLDPLKIKPDHYFIPFAEDENFDHWAKKYEKTIKEHGGIDLQLLGIGTNGHIGLNEPGSALDCRTRHVALTSQTRKSNSSLFKDRPVPLTAMTMGIGTILEAKEIILIATGESKAKIIQKLIQGDVNSHIPATALKLHKNVKLFLDKEAAKLIK